MNKIKEEFKMTGKELLERFNLGEKLTVKFIKEIENGSSCSQ